MTGTTTEASPRDTSGAAPSDSLASGAAGIALLHIERARSGTGQWDTAHEWVRTTTTSPVLAHPDDSGLFRGAPAVAFMLHGGNQPTYLPALATLDRHIAALTQTRLKRAHQRIDHGHLPALREFDLVSGLTGLGAYLLHRHGSGDLLDDVLAYLVRLTHPLTVDGETLPGWWCPDGPERRATHRWPGGHGNLGLAHGIAGPLALLAAAMRRGVTVSGQADAIDRICAWFDQWRCGTGPRVWWPGTISLPERRTRTVRQPGPPRPSWCYGTPGLARAQQLAALATGDTHRRRLAELALAGCVTVEDQLSQLSDASLCHGWAGLLQATWRTATDPDGASHLAGHLPRLHARMNRHLEDHGPPRDRGLLEGTAGVELVQHTLATNQPPITAWDACLLLDGGHPTTTTPNHDQLGTG